MANTKLTEANLSELSNSIPLFKKKNISLKRGYDLQKDNLYILEAGINTPKGEAKMPLFYDKNRKIIFVGAGYTTDGEPITFPVDKKIIDSAIAFNAGDSTKKTIYVFTDPECPFCQRLEKNMKEKFKKLNVKVILFPLSFHKFAKPMTQWVLRGKTDEEKAKRMSKVMSGDKTYLKEIGLSEENYSEDYNKYQYALLTEDKLQKSKKALEDLKSKKGQDKEFIKDIDKELKILSEVDSYRKKFFKKGELDSFRKYLKASKKAFEEVGATGTPTITDKDFKKVSPANL
jgi:thiol:disulfide interchange protein DsbC